MNKLKEEYIGLGSVVRKVQYVSSLGIHKGGIEMQCLIKLDNKIDR